MLCLLAGCGGSTAAPPPADVAAVGDSITAGSPGWDPNPHVRAQLPGGGDPRSQYEYWVRGVRFRNCGVFGETTEEIAARLGDCVRGTKTVIVQGGINDIARGSPVDEAAANLERMVVAAGADGRRVLLVELLPWTRGHPQADGAIADLNRRIRAIGSRRHVAVVPWHDALEDPATPGAFRNDLTADGDHPSVAGYRILGRLVAARLR